MCIVVWSHGSLKFLVTSWPPTVIIDIILDLIFDMPNGFTVTIFTVLQFTVFVEPDATSDVGFNPVNASLKFCLSIYCLSLCSISFAARSCFTLLIASVAAFS